MLSVVYEAHCIKTDVIILKERLKNKKQIPLLMIKNMRYNQKSNQFINHGNNIKNKKMVHVDKEFIKFSQWKCDSITSTMKGI